MVTLAQKGENVETVHFHRRVQGKSFTLCPPLLFSSCVFLLALYLTDDAADFISAQHHVPQSLIWDAAVVDRSNSLTNNVSGMSCIFLHSPSKHSLSTTELFLLVYKCSLKMWSS